MAAIEAIDNIISGSNFKINPIEDKIKNVSPDPILSPGTLSVNAGQ